MSNKYKVLITTSGLGQRLGDITKYTNKSLVRIGKKPAISYIIESYPKNIELIITTGYFGDQVKNFIKLAYPERKITFVNIKKYQGKGSSLGYSMLCAKKYLQCPFIFHAADTIVINEKIPTPDTDWSGGFKGEGAAQYSSFKTNNNKILKINPKNDLDFDYLHIGLIGIKNYHNFWSTLNNLYKKNPNDSTLNDCAAINEMLKNKKEFIVKEFKNWFDTGNVESLNKARKNISDSFDNLNKLEESIFIFDKFVIKFFFDDKLSRDRVKRAKMLKGLVPPILGHTKNFYKYKNIQGSLYSRSVTPYDFYKFLNWCKKNLWHKNIKIDRKKFKEICYDFYYNKTQKRINQFLTINDLEDTNNIINDEKVPSIQEMLKMIDFEWLCDTDPYQFHGDFILDNILKTNKGYCLLDWRQNFGKILEAGDIYYDLSKLNHNLTVNHDIIHQNLFTIKINKNNIKCDILRKNKLVESQKILHDFIKKEGFNLKKVEILTALIWINMSPLHHHPFNLFLYYFGKLNLWKILKNHK